MKKLITIILLAILTTGAFSQTDNTLKWQSAPLIIDGNIADWVSRPPFFDNTTKTSFDMRNDSLNLYLEFQMPDQRTQFKIARAGMSLVFDIKLKPKRKAGIYFSPFINEKPGQHPAGSGDKKGPSIIRQKYLLSPPDVMASGFAFSKDDISDNKDKTKLTYFADWDSLNCMTVEFMIPLRELFGDNYVFSQVVAQEISMTFQENAIEKPTQTGQGEAGDNGHQGGEGGFQQNNGGGFGQNDMGTGHQNASGTGFQERSAMFEFQVLKQKFKLNSKGK